MTMVTTSISALVRRSLNSVQSILTSPDFGTEYELLCTELSVQWLRIRLWGEPVGLNIATVDGLHSLLDRPDIHSTVSKTLNVIVILLTEIESLRLKYQLNPSQTHSRDASKAIKHACSNTSLDRLSPIKPAITFQQSMRENQRQKSVIALAKWTVYDSRRFGDKVRRLRGFIDGLEDISKAAGISRQLQARLSTFPPTAHEEHPPPYSVAALGSRRRSPHPLNLELISTSVSESDVGTVSASTISEQYVTLKRYLATSLRDGENLRWRTPEKLLVMSDENFKELSTDVLDELIRRQQCGTRTPDHDIPAPAAQLCSLPNHPHRMPNEAQEKLSKITPSRFRHLATDVFFEIERRFPYPKDEGAEIPSHVVQFPYPLIGARSMATRRYGFVLPPNFSSPLLQYRAAHQSSFADIASVIETPSAVLPRPRDKPSRGVEPPRITSSARQPTLGTEMFKSFRVKPSDSCRTVLPAALKRFDSNALPQAYALHIVYGDRERCVGMDEKPLIIFKQLEKQGMKPLFMLRKDVNARSTASDDESEKLRAGTA